MNMLFFFFNDTATTEIYTLSLHDALPISRQLRRRPRTWPATATDLAEAGAQPADRGPLRRDHGPRDGLLRDRKSTRLNSSHANISYAVFCLKKKKKSRPRGHIEQAHG